MHPPGYWLCFGFFFSSWGDRMWNFAVGLYLVKLTPGSLQLTAIYGMVMTAFVILFAPVMGEWIDRTNRLTAMKKLLILQNLLVIISAIFVSLILFKITNNEELLLVFEIIIVLTGALANLASQGEQISLTKDWVVVICGGNKDYLARLNGHLRRIDLAVAILAPVAVGALMSMVSDLAGIVLVCVWNVISMVIEYLQLHHTYIVVPNLSVKHATNVELLQDANDHGNEREQEDQDAVVNKSYTNCVSHLKQAFHGWLIYKKQSVAMAGVSLALLYLTVLGFSAVTAGYAQTQNLKEVYVSICFGLGASWGIVGTIVFSIIRRKIGLVKTGLFGFIFQLTMLLLCVASIWAPGSPSNLKRGNNYINQSLALKNISVIQNSTNNTILNNISEVNHTYQNNLVSIILLMVGLILSRMGLWISDLTITQLQQEYVPEDERGVVGGTQTSFNSILDLLHYVLTVLMPRPEWFGILILISVSAVMTALVTYLIFLIKFLKRINENVSKELANELVDITT